MIQEKGRVIFMKKAIAVFALLALSVPASCGTAAEMPTELTTTAATTASIAAALELNEALLAEIGMTHGELSEKYGAQTTQDDIYVQFEKGSCTYYFVQDIEDWDFRWIGEKQPTATDICRQISVTMETLVLGLANPIAKEDLLAECSLEEPDGYGPPEMSGYRYGTVLYNETYSLSIFHNQWNMYGPEDVARVIAIPQ